MELYHNRENIISSDEYSDEDVEDQNLIQDSKNENKNFIDTRKSSYRYMLKKDANSKTSKMKFKCLTRKKLASVAKKRSVKWLNNRKKREKYKSILNRILKRNCIPPSLLNVSLSESLDKIVSAEKGIMHSQHNIKKDLDLEHTAEKLMVKRIENIKGFSIITSNQNALNKENNAASYMRKIVKSRSISPTVSKSNTKQMHVESYTSNSSLLCKEVNKLFPKYNRVLKNYVGITSDTVEGIELKINETLMEIQTLSDMIRTKELEWNKLLHLRKVKEEIILHLTRKKNVMEFKEKHKSKIHFTEQKNLEFTSTLDAFSCFDNKCSPSTAQSLVENRANMKSEDLEKEKPNINRLHSILVSENILPNSKSRDHISNHISGSSFQEQFLCHKSGNSVEISESENGGNINERKRALNDAKRIIADYRHTKFKDYIRDRHTTGNKQLNSKTELQDHVEQLLKTTKNIHLVTKREFKEKDVPMCQACTTEEARFVCAGCGDQWYCSRKCQVSAWDNHSNICKE